MAVSKLVVGDDFLRTVQLYKTTNGVEATFVISGSATVKAAIVNGDRTSVLTPTVNSLIGDSGADWSISTVAIHIPEADTLPISSLGAAYLEIQVADPLKQTWFIPIQIINGLIA